MVQLTASAEGTTIVVEADGTMEVWFEGGLALPEEYHFTDCDTTDTEAAQVLNYLAQRYSALLEFDQPEQVLSGMWNLSDEEGVHQATGGSISCMTRPGMIWRIS